MKITILGFVMVKKLILLKVILDSISIKGMEIFL